LIVIPEIEVKVNQNELQAITKLCKKGAHLHIVTVLKIGELRDTPFLFIDMELCDLDLAEYIHCTKAESSVLTYFVKDQPPPLKAQQIWNVMLHIAKGVQYLHSKDIVHRDLKPANGNFLATI
jgi:serine/threonine protein kinase